MIAFHSIPNEVLGAFILDGLRRADRLEQAQRAATITLPRASYREIPPAHVVDAVQRRGK